ncbi:MAG: uracil-DNA glycosylase [Sphaerochaetaceae bacterium]|nr:uracil-DNA glycosylase [Sphaerochaetaceae bacterium]
MATLIDSLRRIEHLCDDFSDILKTGHVGEKERTASDFSMAERRISGKSDIAAPDCTEESLESLYACLKKCTGCILSRTRNNVVCGEGCTDCPEVMVIGEGPGENEDLMGRPFVGKAGQYLDKWLESVSLSRDTNTYITNIVKCRPPQNRDPMPSEKETCLPYLKKQIEIINPKTILCLGKPSSTLMTGKTDATMVSLRGRFFFYDSKIPMICTYHPAAVLRDPSLRRAVWEDLKKLAGFLNLEVKHAK